MSVLSLLRLVLSRKHLDMWKASSLTPRDAQAMEPQCGPSQAQSDFLAPVVLDLSLGSPKSRPERRVSVLLVYSGGEHKKQSERE